MQVAQRLRRLRRLSQTLSIAFQVQGWMQRSNRIRFQTVQRCFPRDLNSHLLLLQQSEVVVTNNVTILSNAKRKRIDKKSKLPAHLCRLCFTLADGPKKNKESLWTGPRPVCGQRRVTNEELEARQGRGWRAGSSDGHHGHVLQTANARSSAGGHD